MKGGNSQLGKMKAGIVVQIRVPPADVMTCIDLCRNAGLIREGTSMAEVVRMALSGLCGGARKAGIVPARTGFEFNEMVAPFKVWPQARKLQITENSWQKMRAAEAGDFAPPTDQIADRHFVDAEPAKPALNDEEWKRIRYLATKRTSWPEGPKAWEQAHPELAREYYALDDRIPT